MKNLFQYHHPTFFSDCVCPFDDFFSRIKSISFNEKIIFHDIDRICNNIGDS